MSVAHGVKEFVTNECHGATRVVEKLQTELARQQAQSILSGNCMTQF